MSNILTKVKDVIKYSKGGEFNGMLSFCIPTLNRPKEFELLLSLVIPELTREVELLIKDDSIGTESEKIFERLVSGHNINYRYYRGEKKGIDLANIFIAENARGKFVWWFGDDDELLPGGIARVLAAIKSHPRLAFIWINLFVGNVGGKAAIPIAADKLLTKGDDFLKEVGIDMTLLSTGVFNREIALPALSIAKKYIGSHFASQPFIFEAVASGPTLLIAQPFILNHPTELKKGQNLFWDGVKTMGVAYFDILMEFRGKFSRRAIRGVLARNFGHIWRGLVIGWIRRDTEAPRRRLLELSRYWSYPEFYPALIIFLLPKSVVRGLLFAYKKIYKKSYLQD